MGVNMLLIHGLVGAFLSAFLTLTKFWSTYDCMFSLFSACKVGNTFDCEKVLTSRWSTFYGALPISIPATSYYVVIICLALALLIRPRAFERVAPPILLALTLLGVVVIIPLAFYAFLHGGCSFCLIIYLINIILLLSALMMNPSGLGPSLHALASKRIRLKYWTIAVTALSFLALSGVQSVAYLKRSDKFFNIARCFSKVAPLPDPSFTITGSPGPVEFDVALFLDPACEVCMREYDEWKHIPERSNGRIRLGIYHLPRKERWAANAIECARHRGEDKARALLEGLFQRTQENATKPLHDDFILNNKIIMEVAEETGLGDVVTFSCYRNDEAALKKVDIHEAYAKDHGLQETPATIAIFHDQGHPLDFALVTRGEKAFTDTMSILRRGREQAQQLTPKVTTSHPTKAHE